jgi:ABC-type lipoprotein release transport system permease subunit
MLSLRYLRARRQEGFISIIAGFSFLGIMLGVATLIIVMAVMNGFRKELLGKILGLNGHLLVQPLESPLTDYQAVAERISKLDGIRLAVPIVEARRWRLRRSTPRACWFAASAATTSTGSPRSPRTSSRARSTASIRGRAW